MGSEINPSFARLRASDANVRALLGDTRDGSLALDDDGVGRKLELAESLSADHDGIMDDGAVRASALDAEIEYDVLRLANPRHRARGVVQLRVQIEALKWRVRTKHGGSESVWDAYPVVVVLPPEVMKTVSQ